MQQTYESFTQKHMCLDNVSYMQHWMYDNDESLVLHCLNSQSYLFFSKVIHNNNSLIMTINIDI